MPSLNSDTSRWFVLNHIAPASFGRNESQAAVDRFNRHGHDLELFAPTFVRSVEKNGKLILSEQPLTFHYVFVRGTEPEIIALCAETNGYSMVLSRTGSHRYAYVPDREMDSFRIIARAYANRLPYYSVTEADLEEGDEVEVIDGPFKGLVGIYKPRTGSSSGNIIVSVSLDLATAVFDVKARNVRIIRFASNSKRAYDYVDTFIPRLFSALRTFHSSQQLSTAEITSLSIFCSRMKGVRPDNHKFGAKLAAILCCAQLILGKTSEMFQAKEMLYRYLPSVTNPWTKALIDLVMSIPTGDMRLFNEGLSLIGATADKESKMKQELREEYDYYSSAQCLIKNA